MRVLMTRKRTHWVSDHVVRDIRRKSSEGWTGRDIARLYGLSDGYVSLVKNYHRRINMHRM